MIFLPGAAIAAKLSGRAIAAIGAAIVVLAAFLAGVKVNDWRWQAKWNKAQTAAAEAREKQQQEARDRERGMLAAREKSEARYVERIVAVDRRARAAAADGERLRGALAEYVAAGMPEDPGAACRADDRAATLAGLLGTLDRLAEECAKDAERLAEQVTGLRDYARTVSDP